MRWLIRIAGGNINVSSRLARDPPRGGILVLIRLRRRARPFYFPKPLLKGVAEAALYCAHRTSTVSSCAFCEQEGHLAAPAPSFRACAFREHFRYPLPIGGGLVDLPLRASNEGLLRPRVARAQEIDQVAPFLFYFSASAQMPVRWRSDLVKNRAR